MRGARSWSPCTPEWSNFLSWDGEARNTLAPQPGRAAPSPGSTPPGTKTPSPTPPGPSPTFSPNWAAQSSPPAPSLDLDLDPSPQMQAPSGPGDPTPRGTRGAQPTLNKRGSQIRGRRSLGVNPFVPTHLLAPPSSPSAIPDRGGTLPGQGGRAEPPPASSLTPRPCFQQRPVHPSPAPEQEQKGSGPASPAANETAGLGVIGRWEAGLTRGGAPRSRKRTPVNYIAVGDRSGPGCRLALYKHLPSAPSRLQPSTAGGLYKSSLVPTPLGTGLSGALLQEMGPQLSQIHFRGWRGPKTPQHWPQHQVRTAPTSGDPGPLAPSAPHILSRTVSEVLSPARTRGYSRWCLYGRGLRRLADKGPSALPCAADKSPNQAGCSQPLSSSIEKNPCCNCTPPGIGPHRPRAWLPSVDSRGCPWKGPPHPCLQPPSPQPLTSPLYLQPPLLQSLCKEPWLQGPWKEPTCP